MPIDLKDYYNQRFITGHKYCAIYIVGPQAGRPCKVGYATRITERMGCYAVGNWVELFLHDIFWTPGRLVAKPLEAAIHERLADSRIRGEWFGLPSAEIGKVVREMAAILYPGVRFFDHAGMMKMAERCPTPTGRGLTFG